MIDHLNNHLIIKLSENEMIEKENIEIYKYGLNLLSATIIKIIVLAIISSLFGLVKETFLFIICFSSLRIQAGGIHANTLLKCLIMTLTITFTSLFLIDLLPSGVYIYFQIASILLSIIVIYSFAPIESSNKPLTPKEKVLYKNRSMVTVVIWGIITLMLYITYGSNTHLGNIIAISLVAESLTLIL